MDSRDLGTSGWVTFLRGFAYVYAVIGFVGGLILAVSAGFLVLIASWLSTALIVALLMSHTDNAENIRLTKLYAHRTALAVMAMEKANDSTSSVKLEEISPISSIDSTDFWLCSCGDKNTGTTRFCKSCSKYKQ